MNGRIEQAIEEIIDQYMRDYDFSDMEDGITKAVIEEVQSELDKLESLETDVQELKDKNQDLENHNRELENRIMDLESKLSRMLEALR